MDQNSSAETTLPLPNVLRGDDQVFLTLPESSSAAVKAAFLLAATELSGVENRIASVFQSSARELSDVANYLLGLGGKRIRPLFALLVSRLVSGELASPRLIDAASGIELIHMATLLHDDIIDQSAKRRHKPSALAQYGFVPTLLAGDFLWVRAFGLCAHLGEYIVRATEQACVELTEGEVLEGKLVVGQPYDLDRYFDVIAKKTASLFWLSSAIGAECGLTNSFNLKPPISAQHSSVLNNAVAFGRSAGMAFQIIDDILDVTADEDLLGKPTGADLRQHTPTLVNILWLEREPKIAGDFFSTTPTAESVAQAVSYLRTSAVLDSCRQIAQDYTKSAKTTLNSLPLGGAHSEAARNALDSILQFTLERCC